MLAHQQPKADYIVDHRKQQGTLQAQVKWVDVPHSGNTWVSMSDLPVGLVQEYWKINDISPPSDTESSDPSQTAEKDVVYLERELPKEVLETESWDELLQDVVGFKNNDNGISVLLLWNNGVKSMHDMSTASKKSPQTLIRFFESNLQFVAPISN